MTLLCAWHTRVFYLFIGNFFLWIKNAPQGSHCGGYEICRKSDPPQAENLASEILFYFMVKTVMGWQENPHKMRSAQTPFGAWAIMKKFILYALLSGSLISSLTVSKVYQPIMNKIWTQCESLVNFTKKHRNKKRNCTNCIKMCRCKKCSIHGVLVVTGE